MDIFKLAASVIVIAAVSLVLKQYKQEYSLLIAVAAGIFIYLFAFEWIAKLISFMHELTSSMGDGEIYFLVLLKCIGTAYVVHFASDVCKDSGEAALASKIEMAGKVVLLVLSLPVFKEVMSLIAEMLK